MSKQTIEEVKKLEKIKKTIQSYYDICHKSESDRDEYYAGKQAFEVIMEIIDEKSND